MKKKDKILLINPPVKWINSPAYDRKWPPLSLAYSAAILENHDFNVEILDANVKKMNTKQMIKKADYADKIFVTTSPIDKWQCPEPNIKHCLDLVKRIGRYNSDVYLLGAHGTMRPKKILELTNVKAIIRGEPELTILELCRDKNLEKVKGITFSKDEDIVSNPQRETVDLNKFPFPAFHLLPMDKYFYEILGDRFTLFEGSRGCPFSCSYCLKSMYSGGYRKKSSKKLIDEIKEGIEEFDLKNAYFMDLEFCLDKEWVEEICDFLIEKNYDFNWTCQTRFDNIDLNLLKKMKKAGCEIIHFGVESGSSRILDMIKKDITLGEIKKGMENIKKVGLKSVCFFMFGLPTETKEEMLMTVKLAKELNPTYASFHIAVPYPGTRFYEKANIDREEMFPSFYRDKEELNLIKEKAYKSFYLRPEYIFSRLRQGEMGLLKKQIKLFFRNIKKVKSGRKKCFP